VLDCSRCGGQFVEHQTLRSLLERKRQLGRASLGGFRQQSLPSAAVVYRPCPLCGELMNRRNFGGRSGVVLDVCTRHGTWCESGELPAVLAFVASGGLERVRPPPSRESSRSVAAHVGNPPAPPLDPCDALLVAVELLALVLEP
jgi:Zn-finger nucleic acid-binding protein